MRVWPHGSGLIAVALTGRAGRRVLTAARDGVAVLRDIESGGLVRTWRHRAGANVAAASPGGRRMLMANEDRVVTLCDVRRGMSLSSWEHECTVTALALSADRQTTLVGAGHAALQEPQGVILTVEAWHQLVLISRAASRAPFRMASSRQSCNAPARRSFGRERSALMFTLPDAGSSYAPIIHVRSTA